MYDNEFSDDYDEEYNENQFDFDFDEKDILLTKEDLEAKEQFWKEEDQGIIIEDDDILTDDLFDTSEEESKIKRKTPISILNKTKLSGFELDEYFNEL